MSQNFKLVSVPQTWDLINGGGRLKGSLFWLSLSEDFGRIPAIYEYLHYKILTRVHEAGSEATPYVQ